MGRPIQRYECPACGRLLFSGNIDGESEIYLLCRSETCRQRFGHPILIAFTGDSATVVDRNHPGYVRAPATSRS